MSQQDAVGHFGRTVIGLDDYYRIGIPEFESVANEFRNHHVNALQLI